MASVCATDNGIFYIPIIRHPRHECGRRQRTVTSACATDNGIFYFSMIRRPRHQTTLYFDECIWGGGVNGIQKVP